MHPERSFTVPAERLGLVAALALAPAFGLVALALGQDVNWDLRNYHYYNPYAFLTGRFGFDIVPAQLPTFYNPFLYVPYYFLVEAAAPRTVGFVLGSVQGLNLALLYLIACRALALPRGPMRAGAAFALALAGMTGAGMVAELGTSFFDNALSLFFLGSLALIVVGQQQLAEGALRAALPLAAAAGLVIGIAVGLKQTMLIYALGLNFACLAVGGGWRRALAVALAFGIGVIAGIAAGGGWWMWFLWQRYGNPIFPHFNSIFRSPMAPLTDRRDPAFLPGTLAEALVYPFVFAFDSRRVSEIDFRDLRLLFAFCFVATAAAAGIFRWWRGRAPALTLTDAARGRLVLVAAAGTYVVWLPLFSIYRYAIGIEMLAPLLVVLAADRLPAKPAWRAGIIALAAVIVAASYRPGDWGRAPWPGTRDYFAVPVPALERPAETMVIMAGWQPSAYVVPKFPPAVRFVRIQSNFTSPDDVENRHNELMRRIIAAHEGPLYALFTDHEYAAVTAALAVYELKIVWPPCVEMPSNLDRRLIFCPLARAPSGR
jgi:hypothetical protein